MKNLMLIGLLGIGLMAAPAAQAQPVRFGVQVGVGPAWVGPAPVCAYGYYNYYPYACAPYGYYGPQWFSGGVFIGAGPWYHRGFYGHPGYYGGYRYNGRPGFYGHREFEGRRDFRRDEHFDRERGFRGNGRGVHGNERGFRGGHR